MRDFVRLVEVLSIDEDIDGHGDSEVFHSGESMEFGGGLVKKKSTLVLRVLNLFCEPAFLLENAWAENRLAAADEEGG